MRRKNGGGGEGGFVTSFSIWLKLLSYFLTLTDLGRGAALQSLTPDPSTADLGRASETLGLATGGDI